MMRFYLILFAMAGIAWSDAVGADQTTDSPTQIAQWVEQLSADRFAERELATQNLIDVGEAAIESVVAAVQGDDPEAIDRGLHVLRQLGLSDEEQTEDAARAALDRLAAEKESRSSRRAKNTLAYLNELRQDRAIAAIRKLGGTVEESRVNQFIGAWQVTNMYDVTIDEDWQGDVRGLRYIRWLPDLRMVTFRGKQVDNQWISSIEGLEKLSIVELNRTSVGDDGIAKLKSLSGISTLSVKYSPVTDAAIDSLTEVKTASTIMLYGTKISPEGAERLIEATTESGVRIDYRRGAFLGVGCTQTDDGCMISTIHPNSAAQRQDIRAGDIVIEYSGKPVPDFQALTSLISENVAGDKVKLKIRRNGSEELEKELTLGEWD